MKKKELSIAILTLALLGGVFAYLWLGPSGLQKAPDIHVATLDGTQVKLQQYQGKPVLVTFWATTCPGCVKEIPHLVELQHDLGPKGLQIIAIAMSYDDPKQVATMVQQRGMPYTVALDKDGSAAKAFGDVQLTPTSFLISPQGRIVQRKLGEMDFTQVRHRILGMLGSKA
jgi:peroxiredoxin